MMQARAILLDKDGVLVDFHRTWLPAIKKVARAVAEGDEELALKLLVAVGYDEARDDFLPGSIWAGGTLEELIDHWHGMLRGAPRARIATVVHDILIATEPQPAIPLPRLRALLAQARARDVKVAIVTNDVTRSTERTAALFGIADVLDAIICADQCARGKPHPDLVHEAERRLGLAAADMAMVGDNAHDALMARAAGCGLMVGVESGTSGRADLEPLCDIVLPHVGEALEWLLGARDARERDTRAEKKAGDESSIAAS